MVSECANPYCRIEFQCAVGKLFVANHPARRSPREVAAAEYFWLCDTCSEDDGLEIYIPCLNALLGAQAHGVVEISVRGRA